MFYGVVEFPGLYRNGSYQNMRLSLLALSIEMSNLRSHGWSNNMTGRYGLPFNQQ